jgi:hypothetical protein
MSSQSGQNLPVDKGKRGLMVSKKKKKQRLSKGKRR